MKTKKKLWVKIGLGSLVASSVLTTTIIAIENNEKDNFSVLFDGHHFTSEAALAAYARSTLDSRVSANDQQLWSLNDTTGTKFFDSPIEATDFIDQNNITQEQAYVHDNILHGMGELNRLPDNFGITDDPSALYNVFRGRNDSIFLDQNDAYKSLVQVHNVLELDDMYFSHESDLDSYLLEKYDPDSTHVPVNSFALESASGNRSNNMKSFDDQTFDDFVEKNTELNLSLDNGDFKTTTDFKDEMYEEWAIDFFDTNANYVEINSTQGQGLYLIDNVKGTPGSVIGDLLLESAMSPANMSTDGMKHWTHSDIPVEALQNSSITDLQFLSSLSSVGLLQRDILTLSDLINSAQESTDIPDSIHNIFTGNTLSRNNDINQIDEMLSGYTLIDGTDFYESFLETEISLLESKRTTFLQMIPLLRSWAIDKIVISGLPFELVTYINEAMDYALRVIDFSLKDLLEPFLSNDAKLFNISQIYNFTHSPQYQTHPDTYYTNMMDGYVQVPPIYKGVVGATHKSVEEILEFVYAAQAYIALEYSIEPYIDHVNSNITYNNNIENGNPNIPTIPIGYPTLPKSIESIDVNGGNSSGDDWYLSIYGSFKYNLEKYVHLDGFVDRVNKYMSAHSQIYRSAVMEHISKSDKLISSRSAFNDIIDENNIIEGIGASIDIEDLFHSAADTFRKIADVIKTGNDLFSSIDAIPWEKIASIADNSAFLKGLGKTAAVLGVVGAVVTIALIAVDIIMGLIGERITDVYAYNHNYESDFYWNGGEHRLRKLFGFTWKTDKVGTEKFDLIDPITILTPQTSDSYYLHTVNNSLEELKIEWINNIKINIIENGIPDNSNWRWTINLLNNAGQLATFSNTDIEKLKYDIENFSLIENYKINFYYSSDGLVDDPSASIRDMIDSILRNIKVSWVIQFPEYIDGKYVVMPYRIPATKSKPLYGIDIDELDDDLSYQYMILNYNFDDENFDSNNLPNENAKDITDYAINYFFGEVGMDIDSKNVMLTDINSALNFDVLPSKYELIDIFKARMNNGEEVYFTDKSAAQNWVAGNLMFDVEDVENNETIWSYDEYDFRSITDFVNWVVEGNGGNNA